MKLIIGNQNYSSWSLRPWALLKYFELNFEQHRITLFSADMRDQMTPFCPNYKVPVLIDDQETVWDSLAICEYVNEKYLNGKALPKDLTTRARVRAICCEMHSSFFAIRQEMPMNCRRQPSPISCSQSCQNDIDRIINIWQESLTKSNGPFLFGEFSMADAFYLPIASRFNTYQVVVPNIISNYIELMLDLPCYQEWLEASRSEREFIECEEV